MRLLANENFPLASIRVLKLRAFDIIGVGEDYKGVTDQEVIELAIADSRTIITFDRDYGELIFKYGHCPPAGVIYLRWTHFQPDEPGHYLASLFNQIELEFAQALTVIDRESIRQRKY